MPPRKLFNADLHILVRLEKLLFSNFTAYSATRCQGFRGEFIFSTRLTSGDSWPAWAVAPAKTAQAIDAVWAASAFPQPNPDHAGCIASVWKILQRAELVAARDWLETLNPTQFLIAPCAREPFGTGWRRQRS